MASGTAAKPETGFEARASWACEGVLCSEDAGGCPSGGEVPAQRVLRVLGVGRSSQVAEACGDCERLFGLPEWLNSESVPSRSSDTGLS